jgi:hypothetical protein
VLVVGAVDAAAEDVGGAPEVVLELLEGELCAEGEFGLFPDVVRRLAAILARVGDLAAGCSLE